MDYYDITDDRNGVIQVQRALRDLELYENGTSAVPINGNFNDMTEKATRDFQKNYGLNETGTVDSDTWYAIFAVHEEKLGKNRFPRAMNLFPKTDNYALFPYVKDDIIFVIQFLLASIEPEYDDFGVIEFTGIYDNKTQNAIRSFQRKNLIVSDGIINAETLNRLFDEYEHSHYSDV